MLLMTSIITQSPIVQNDLMCSKAKSQEQPLKGTCLVTNGFFYKWQTHLSCSLAKGEQESGPCWWESSIGYAHHEYRYGISLLSNVRSLSPLSPFSLFSHLNHDEQDWSTFGHALPLSYGRQLLLNYFSLEGLCILMVCGLVWE